MGKCRSALKKAIRNQCIAVSLGLSVAGLIGSPVAGASVSHFASHSLVSVQIAGPTGGNVAIPTTVEGQVLVSTRYAAKNGLRIDQVQASGSSTLAALESGKVQFGDVNFPATANAIAAGVPLEIVCVWNLYFPEGIVANGSVHSFSQLQGQPIAINALGDSTQATMIGYATRSKLVDPSSFHWVLSGGNSAQALQLVARGEAAATPASPDTFILAHALFPSLHFLVQPSAVERIAGEMGGVIVTTKSYADAHPKVVVGVVKSFIEAQRALYGSERTYANVAEDISGHAYTSSQLKTLFKLERPTFAVNGGMFNALFDRSFSLWKLGNPQFSSNPYFSNGETIANVRYVSQAVKQLGFMKNTPDSGTMLKGVTR